MPCRMADVAIDPIVLDRCTGTYIHGDSWISLKPKPVPSTSLDTTCDLRRRHTRGWGQDCVCLSHHRSTAHFSIGNVYLTSNNLVEAVQQLGFGLIILQRAGGIPA